MKYKTIQIFVFVTMLVILNAPSLALAAGFSSPIVTCSGAVDAKDGTQKACTVCDIAKVAQNVLNTGIYVAVFLSSVIFVWAGFLYLTNVTNPGQIERAKTLFFDVLVGLVIILAAWLVIDTIMRFLVNPSASLGPWNEICR